MTLAWHSTINSSRVSTIRKEYNAISNDRELSPAAYPPKLIRRMPRNNAGHGREMGLKLSGFFLFFLSLKKAYRLLCIMQDLLSQVFLKSGLQNCVFFCKRLKDRAKRENSFEISSGEREISVSFNECIADPER